MTSPETEVAPVAYPEVGPGQPDGPPADVDLLADVSLDVVVQLGRVRMTVRELLRLREGSVVELDRVAGAPVDVVVNGRVVARGDVVVIDDELGVRISDIYHRR